MLLQALRQFAGTSISEMDKGMLMTVVTATGIIVVFIVLIILILIISIYGGIANASNRSAKKKAVSKSVPAKAETPAAKVMPVAPVMASAQADDNEIIAVIAAAVASMEDGQFVVRSVRRAQQQGRPAWSTAAIMDNVRSF